MAVKCPVCEGKQKVQGGFYDLAGTPTTPYEEPEQCKSCLGKGYIEAIDPERINRLYYDKLNEEAIKKMEERS